MNEEKLIEILRTETESSTGCTDPGSISLAVATATTALGVKPEEISVVVSPNVYKNAASVGIPGTYKSGMELAAVLGALINTPEKGLTILSEVTEELITKAEIEVMRGYVKVTCEEDSYDPLYVRAFVRAGNDTAEAVIRYDYSEVVEISRNGSPLVQKSIHENNNDNYPLIGYTVEELYNQIVSMDTEKLNFLLNYAKLNLEAAKKGLANPRMRASRLLATWFPPQQHKNIFNVINHAQVNTVAAAEARMKGMNVTIMTIAGSGNHGITNFLGVLSVAEELNSTKEQTVKALAISSIITIYIKSYIKRMTAFCGCGVAAATGVAAAVVFLLGGNFEQSVNAMQSVIGTIGGMFCDGAKESCAYKLSTATTTAIQFAYMAMHGCYIPARMGIIGSSIEKTFENIGRLNNPGMIETDRILVSIVQENQSKQP